MRSFNSHLLIWLVAGLLAGAELPPTIPDSEWLPGITGNLPNLDDDSYVVATYQGDVIVGGLFGAAGTVRAPGIARWSTASSTWSGLGTGLALSTPKIGPPTAHALCVVGTDLWVAGRFDSAGGISANNVAKWNGTSWSAIGSGIGTNDATTQTTVFKMVVVGSTVYAGGFINSTKFIHTWNGSSWVDAGIGTDYQGLVSTGVAVLTGTGPQAWSGSQLLRTNGVYPAIVPQTSPTGTTWTNLSTGYPTDTQSTDGVGWIGTSQALIGSLSAPGPTAHWQVSLYNGSSWSVLSDTFRYVAGISTGPGSLAWVCGRGMVAGAIPSGNIVGHNGSSYTRYLNGAGQHTMGGIENIAVDGSTIYVAGESIFSHINGVAVQTIARYQGGAWQALGLGVVPQTSGASAKMAVLGGKLYVGNISSAGGVAVNGIAVWDPGTSAWTSVGTGLTGSSVSVNRLGVYNNKLIVSGSFTSAGGVTVNGFAQFDPAVGTWSSVGTPPFATSGPDFTIGNGFLYTRGIYQFDGTSWSGPINDPASGGGTYTSLVATTDGLYLAAPYYNTNPGVYFLSHSSSTWVRLGGTASVAADVIAVANGQVFAGSRYGYGSNTSSVGPASRFLSHWDGSAWRPVGSGVTGSVTSLLIGGSTLYVGGYFGIAGNQPSSVLARLSLSSAPTITSSSTATGTVGSSFSYTITATATPTSYSATGLPGGLSLNTTTGVISGTPTIAGTFSATIVATNGAGSGSATLTMTIQPLVVGAPVITSSLSASGEVGSAFSYSIVATNTPTSYAASGLPAGISVNTTTGVISGAPAAVGTSSVTISATNGTGTGSTTLTITVVAASSGGSSSSSGGGGGGGGGGCGLGVSAGVFLAFFGLLGALSYRRKSAKT